MKKIILAKTFCFIPFLFITLVSTNAQSVSLSEIRMQLVKDWERAKSYTQEYLDAIPTEKFSFRPVDSVYNFAEQMLHFARATMGMAYISTGFGSIAVQTFRSPNFGKSPASQKKDSVMYYVNTSYDFMIEAIKSVDLDKLGEIVSWDLPGGKRSSTRLGWLFKAFEHQTHHRGQCTVYLRLLGIRPPAEKLWD